jgi:hypothetical protein
MDPVSLALITAIGAGVTNSVTDATKASLVAGYTALKTRLLEKLSGMHPKVPQALTELEAAPTSQPRQAVLVEEIAATDLLYDQELLDLAQTLLQDIQPIASGSQIIHHIQNSAVSNSGIANNYNIQGDQYLKP